MCISESVTTDALLGSCENVAVGGGRSVRDSMCDRSTKSKVSVQVTVGGSVTSSAATRHDGGLCSEYATTSNGHQHP